MSTNGHAIHPTLRLQPAPALSPQPVEPHVAADGGGPVVAEDSPDWPPVPPIRAYSLGELIDLHPAMKAPVVDGLLREGETANIVSSSKMGKSWLAYDLLLAIATGRRWFGRFSTTRGKTLLIDNELHKESLADRIQRVAVTRQIRPPDYRDQIEVWPLRGNLRTLAGIAAKLDGDYESGHFRAIILDAKYRFAAPGTSENDNTSEAQFYNAIDQVAERTRAAIVLIHHSSKGSQAEKRVTDVGSGAGAQSRAADCHLILREHEEDGMVVLDAAVRSFPPPTPLPLRWQHPVWQPDDSVDPAALRGRLPRNEARQRDRDREGQQQILDALANGPATTSQLRQTTGIGYGRAERLLGLLSRDGRVATNATNARGNQTQVYQLATPAEDVVRDA